MNKKRLIILLSSLSLCFPLSSFAETIILKSGKSVEGKLIEKTDKYIRIDFQGLPLTYFFDEVETIDGQRVALPSLSGETKKKGVIDIKDSVNSQPQENVKEKYNLAIDYVLNKDYKNAHNIFGEILNDETGPNKAIVYFNMGMCLQILGVAEKEKKDAGLSQALFAQAEIYYQKAQEILPYFPQLYSNVSLIYYYQHKPQGLVEEMASTSQRLSDELGAFPPDVDNKIYSYKSYEALLSIAANYIAAGNYSDAAGILKDVIKQMEQVLPHKEYLRYAAYNSLGLCLYNLGNNQGAIDYIESSIRLAPSQPKADTSYANLGMLYYKQGNYIKADEAVKKALEINPNNQTALDYQNKLKNNPGR